MEEGRLSETQGQEHEMGGDPFVRLHDALLSAAQTPAERTVAERNIKRFGEIRIRWMGELHERQDNIDSWLTDKLNQQKFDEVGNRSGIDAKHLDIFGQVTAFTPPRLETLEDQQAHIEYSERVLRQLGALAPNQTIRDLETQLAGREPREGAFFDGIRKVGNLESRIPGIHLDVDIVSGKITAGLHKPALERMLGKI